MTFPGSDRGENESGRARSERDELPSLRVAYRLASVTGKPVGELRPLADSIDPDALDQLFGPGQASVRAVTFRHEGHDVTVTGTGDVRVDSAVGE